MKKYNLDDVPAILSRYLEILNRQAKMMLKTEEALTTDQVKIVIAATTAIASVAKMTLAYEGEVKKDIQTLDPKQVLSVLHAPLYSNRGKRN